MGEAKRRWLAAGVFALVGVAASSAVVGCDATPDVVGAGADVPVEEPSAADVPEPPEAEYGPNTKVITPADVTLIETVDIEVTPDKRRWKKGKVGPKKVLTSAPYMELAWGWPMSPSRGFVRVWNTKTPGERAADEARLVDFETGVVRSYAGVGLQYPKLGIARGKERKDGEVVRVLIHASDGLAVPWRSPLFERQSLEINGGTGQAWIVELDEGEEGTGRYLYWDNLREVPGTKVMRLPFTQGTFRPSAVFDSAKVPTIVDGDDWAPRWCKAVEMLDGGGWRCVDEGMYVFVDGWRMAWEESTPVAYNVLTKERQRLELGGCGITSGGLSRRPTWNPPRALLYCGDDYAWVVWSPTGVVRFPEDWWTREEGTPFNRWSTDRTVFSTSNHDELGRSRTWNWVDLRALRGLRTSALEDETPYYGLPAKLVRLLGSKQLLQLDLGRSSLAELRFGKPCSNNWIYAGEGGRWLFGCERPRGRSVSTLLVDVDAHVGWTFPVLVGRSDRGWYVPSENGVVGVVRSASGQRLTFWRPTP